MLNSRISHLFQFAHDEDPSENTGHWNGTYDSDLEGNRPSAEHLEHPGHLAD